MLAMMLKMSFLKLIQAADNDIAKAERGYYHFLDEIDKLAKVHVGASITKDPSGEGCTAGIY